MKAKFEVFYKEQLANKIQKHNWGDPNFINIEEV